MLIGLAAAQWKVDRQHLVAADGRVTDPATKRSLDYAALAKGQQLTETVPAEDPLDSRRAVDGRGTIRAAGGWPGFCYRASHRYPSDQKLPDMLHGKVLRPAAFEASLASLDTKEAELIAGVTVVRDGNFVGVTAPTVETASRRRPPSKRSGSRSRNLQTKNCSTT